MSICYLSRHYRQGIFAVSKVRTCETLFAREPLLRGVPAVEPCRAACIVGGQALPRVLTVTERYPTLFLNRSGVCHVTGWYHQ